MKITKITISNFLKLKDVEMNPSDANVIVGKNKQGKTSVLKAIRAAFTGDADSTAIRVGGDKAEITLELDDLNIKRTVTQKGNYLDISNKQGMKMPAPQRYLDGILGTFSFNPIEFFEKKPAERKKYLLNALKLTITPEELAEYTGEKLAGIDYDAHALEVVEAARKYYYDKRTVANAEKDRKKKALLDITSKIPEGFAMDPGLDEKVKALGDKLTEAKLNNQKIEQLGKDIAFMKVRIDGLKKMLEEETARIEAMYKEEEGMKMIDIAALDKEYAELSVKASEQREAEFTARKGDELRSELDTAIEDASKLDVVVKKLTKEVPAALIEKAKLPIEGLSVNGDDLLINGVSLDNLSSSEQLRVGLQVVRALNGEFKVICIDGVELLDGDSFSFFLKEVENDGYQYFVTRVTDEKIPHSIKIEDGAIVAQA